MKCMCISNKFILNLLNGICCRTIVLILVSLLPISSSSLSTTSPASLSASFNNSHETSCTNIKDLLIQRGIVERDIPKFPIKGEFVIFM